MGVLALFTFPACNSNLDLDKKLSFSKLSVEEQKNEIEQNGMDLVDAVDGVKDTKAYIGITNFLSVANNDAAYVKPFKQLSKDIQNRNNYKLLTNLDKQLRAAYVESDFWGEYNWDTETNDFEKVSDLTNKAILNFPAGTDPATNNGQVIITYTDSKVLMPDTEDYYPSEMTFTMKIDGATALEATFEGSYETDGTPKSVKQTLDIDTYSWSAQVKNSSDEASEKYKFKKGTKTLIQIEVVAKGDLTVDAIENSESADEFLSSATIYYQIMDIAMIGGIKDMKTFADDMRDTKTDQEEVDVINNHLICYGYYTDTNKKFADVEFYLKEVTEEYSYYDYYTEQWVYTTNTSTAIAPRFVLSDKSKVDIEDYFATGFDDLMDQLAELASDYQN